MNQKKLVSEAMRLLGSRTSKKKAKSSAANGKLGGRPKGRIRKKMNPLKNLGKFILVFLISISPCYAKPHVTMPENVKDRDYLIHRLEQVIKNYLPGTEDAEWKIFIQTRQQYLSNPANGQSPKENMFPPRCTSFINRHETHCMAPFVREFSDSAVAGTMAHEFGHMLCGEKEEEADRCGLQLLRGASWKDIH